MVWKAEATSSGHAPSERLGQMKVELSLEAPTAADLAMLLKAPLSPSAGALPSRSVAQPMVQVALTEHRHPQANREIVLNGMSVAYVFAYGQRRTIGMRVDAQGLQVRAPRWVTQAQVHAVLQRKAAWIVGKLQQPPTAEQQVAAPWVAGMRLSVLGRELHLHSMGLQAGRMLNANLQLSTNEAGEPVLTLSLGLPEGDPRWPQAVQRWLQLLAQRYFKDRLDHFAQQMQVQWQRLSLSSARTRWGSANSQGTIRLHWRLIQLSPDVVDYVVVHELAHLREMNHSARFWAIVREHMPDYEARRKKLKQVRLSALG